MRILVGTDQWSPDAIGGSARVATGTSTHLARAGHDVTVIAPAVRGLPASELIEGVSVHRSLRRGLLPQTVGDVIETWRAARRHPSPDVLVSHQATDAVGLLLAHGGTPLVHVFHASAPLEERFLRRRLRGAARARSTALDPLLVLLERIAVRRARVVVVLSDYSARLVGARHPGVRDRLVKVSGGLDVGRFAGGDRARGRRLAGAVDATPLLLTVRRLEPRMGIEELVRAAALLAGRGVPVRLAIAGTGPIREPLERLADSLGLDGRVVFLGRVPDDDLPHVYAGADLFVLPTVAYEGFGISTVEALAAGTPVVGTPVGATPEVLAPFDESLVTNGTSPEELAATIERALPTLSAERRASAREYAGRFSWESTMPEWIAAVERAVT